MDSVLIVTDIDRGGSLCPSLWRFCTLRRICQKKSKGFIINKFRGDKSLLEDGLTMMKDLTGVPVVGYSLFRNKYS